MKTNSIEDSCAIIERLLDDAFGAEKTDEGLPKATVPGKGLEEDLIQSIQNLKILIGDDTTLINSDERKRLFTLMERFIELESKVHAHLSWFEDLAKSLRGHEDR
jgi:hypothetical protein